MATVRKCDNETFTELRNEFLKLNNEMINAGLDLKTLRTICSKKNCIFMKYPFICCLIVAAIAVFLSALTDFSLLNILISYALGTRCILPNNYFIWEATRPISDCQFCINVTRPIILPNVTREDFAPYAYSSKPIIVKQAVKHWRAINHFNFDFLKELYGRIEGAYESVEEECQFLHFHSNFVTLRDVFEMSEARARFSEGEESWYVGW